MDNREIKVRAYDNDLKKIVTQESSGLKNWEILQRYSQCDLFTGLKDCNGKEIFEGDIVEITSGLCPSFKASVIYKNGLCRLESEKGVIAGTLNDYVISIIGNIHQTKEP